MGIQPILTVTGPVRKIKGATVQHYVDFDVAVSVGVNCPSPEWVDGAHSLEMEKQL